MANLTPKQEKFCQKYIETGNASEAYRQSYDCENMADETINVKASELLNNGKITVRLDELRNKHAKRHAITVDTLLAELEEVRQLALVPKGDNGAVQLNVAVNAIMGKAKLLGLDKKVVDNISSDGSMTPTQLTADEFEEIAKNLVKKI